MTWNRIDSSTINGNTLDLYESDGVYMVRVGGMELMSGYWHESEDLLGSLAFRCAPNANPRILLGGLGLGYSLASLSTEMGDAGTITVAEISGSIIDWFERYMRPQLFETLPANVTIVETDISDMIRSGQVFDVIALDVDNGPEAISCEENGFIYSHMGLNALLKCLTPQGSLLIWSSFECGTLVSRAEEIGFHSHCVPIALASKSQVHHYVYILSLQKLTQNDLDRLAA